MKGEIACVYDEQEIFKVPPPNNQHNFLISKQILP